MRKVASALAGLGIALVPGAAMAVPVTLSGAIINSCVLSITQAGQLVATADGTSLRSDTGLGARPAVIGVVAAGASPTLSISTPALSGPGGFTPDSVQFAYSVTGTGASRGFAATSATASSRLIDTVTIDGLVTSSQGFPAGSYTETVQVTCAQ